MLARAIEGGIEFGVRVSPGSRRTRVVGTYGDRLKVQVAAVAEAGKANLAVRKLLAETFGVTLMDVEIVHGETSSDKVVRLRGVTVNALSRFVSDDGATRHGGPARSG